MSKPKMTDWFPTEIKPVHVGEYNASTEKRADALRWWDGRLWSFAYYANDCKDEKQHKRLHKRDADSPIHWRGLASKPKGWKP